MPLYRVGFTGTSLRWPARLLLAGALLVGVASCKDSVSPGDMPRKEGLPVSSAAGEGIDSVALARLAANAEAAASEAVVILRNGRIVYENYFGFTDDPIYAMSASKSFVSLAFGFLLTEGKLSSLDQRVETQLPHFSAVDARKAGITYRQLLTQTSGINPGRSPSYQNDLEAFAMGANCSYTPGAGWQYANGGVDLLSVLAGKLAGEPMDQYLNEKLFQPMGISSVSWARDRKGVPYGAGEMRIRPLDMAKVGQAMLDGGKWQGKQVIPASWVAQVSQQSNVYEPTYGLLWWRGASVLTVGATADLVAQWREYGLPDSTAQALSSLVGRSYPTVPAYVQALQQALSSDQYNDLLRVFNGDHIPTRRNLTVGPMAYYAALGWLGQYLVIVPDKHLVGVRMRRNRQSDYTSPTEVDTDPSFPADVAALVR